MRVLNVRIGRALGAVLLLAALAACKVDSLHPVTPLEASAPDLALYGLWRHRADGELAYVHIGPEFSLAAERQPRRMRIVIVDHKANGLTEEAYAAHASRAGGDRYLNVVQEENGQPAGFILVRYRLVGKDALRLATVDERKLKEAIAQGRIAGTTRGDGISSETAMTASSAEVEAFLRTEGARLFGKEIALRRVR